MKIGFDLISDLNLSPGAEFNWEGKATSLYCVIAGNISHDLRTIALTLSHLSQFYQGIFYTMGSLEYHGIEDINARTDELMRICYNITNVSVLHHHVIIIDGVAILGCNGWYCNTSNSDLIMETKVQTHRYEDLGYLKNSIEKLQRHLDVTKILLVTNSVPNNDLYFGKAPPQVDNQLPPSITLAADTQSKISHWVFGTDEKIVDTVIHDINYVSNPKYNREPYWAKRIEIEV